jgi:hypothetical protein
VAEETTPTGFPPVVRGTESGHGPRRVNCWVLRSIADFVGEDRATGGAGPALRPPGTGTEVQFQEFSRSRQASIVGRWSGFLAGSATPPPWDAALSSSLPCTVPFDPIMDLGPRRKEPDRARDPPHVPELSPRACPIHGSMALCGKSGTSLLNRSNQHPPATPDSSSPKSSPPYSPPHPKRETPPGTAPTIHSSSAQVTAHPPVSTAPPTPHLPHLDRPLPTTRIKTPTSLLLVC